MSSPGQAEPKPAALGLVGRDQAGPGGDSESQPVSEESEFSQTHAGVRRAECVE